MQGAFLNSFKALDFLMKVSFLWTSSLPHQENTFEKPQILTLTGFYDLHFAQKLENSELNLRYCQYNGFRKKNQDKKRINM